MLMADTFAIFFVVLGFLLALPALWLLALGLWPKLVSDATTRCSQGLIRLFLIGLLPTFFAVVLIVIFKRIPGGLGNILAIATACFYLLFAQAGVAGLATCVGRRLESSTDQKGLWRATLRGAIVLELPFLLPVLGWFILFPVATIVGVGASFRFFLSRLFSVTRRRSDETDLADLPEFKNARPVGASQ